MNVMNVVEMVMIAGAMLVTGWALGRGRGAPADPKEPEEDASGVAVPDEMTEREKTVDVLRRATLLRADKFDPGEAAPLFSFLPTLSTDPDGVHVALVAGGLRASLLPLCLRGMKSGFDVYSADLRKADKDIAFGAPSMKESPAANDAGAALDLGEVGGFDLYHHKGELLLRLHSVSKFAEAGGGIKGTIGPLQLGDVEELLKRFQTAYEALPPSAMEKSIVKLHHRPVGSGARA